MRTLGVALFVVTSVASAAAAAPAPAAAGEVLGGAFAHNVNLPTTIGAPEAGSVDLQAGLRTAPVARLLGATLRGQLLGSLNPAGGVSFASAGLLARWRLSDRLYLQPGVALALHDGPGGDGVGGRPDRLYLGSRVVFQLELMLGLRLSDRAALEVGQVHLSHAQLFSGQNPGMDNLGARLVLRF